MTVSKRVRAGSMWIWKSGNIVIVIDPSVSADLCDPSVNDVAFGSDRDPRVLVYKIQRDTRGAGTFIYYPSCWFAKEKDENFMRIA